MPKSKRILIPVIVLVVVAIAAIGVYFGQGSGSLAGGVIEASGTVEAVEINIASEMSGRVVEVNAAKGQVVEAGDILLRLDDELLRSQRQKGEQAFKTAEAALKSADSGLDLAQATLISAQAGLDAAEANSQAEVIVAEQSLQALYDNSDVSRTRAQGVLAAANRALREATYQMDNYTVPSNQKNLTTMEAIDVMKARLDAARLAFEPYRYEESSNDTREDLKEKLDEAQADYDAAVKRLEYETAVAKAEAALQKALEDLQKVQNGPNPDDIAALEARIAAIRIAPEQAKAAVEQARVGVEQAQTRVEQAQEALAQAQAELDLIEVQIGKLVVTAPSAGMVLSRSVEPGEVIQAGSPLMTLGQLSTLTVKVYIPEDRYGLVNLGDSVKITVDSFPGKSFDGTVSYIADQAEFTPRNVQTSEGRRTTVFAIEVTVDNLENSAAELKPGMPADVCFGCR